MAPTLAPLPLFLTISVLKRNGTCAVRAGCLRPFGLSKIALQADILLLPSLFPCLTGVRISRLPSATAVPTRL